MKFEPGMICRTRDGREVEILKIAPHSAACRELGTGRLSWEYLSTLAPPKRTREVTVWCNLYSDGWTDVRETEDDAKDIASCNLVQDKLLAVAVPVTFTVEW